LWAIGNISGDSTNYRDLILKANGLDPIIKILSNTKNPTTIKVGT
jgi:hypothetical protein